MKKQLQDNHFVTIPGWVINHLHLTGDDAIVYSLILGYKEGFQEPLSHIAQWIGSEDTVRRCLLRLTKQGCIDVCRRGGKPTIYRCKPLASCDPLQVATPCNLLPQPLASCDPNNIYNISTTTESARTCTCEGDEKNATAGDKCETPTNDKQRILGWLLDDTDGLTILLHRRAQAAERTARDGRTLRGRVLRATTDDRERGHRATREDGRETALCILAPEIHKIPATNPKQ